MSKPITERQRDEAKAIIDQLLRLAYDLRDHGLNRKANSLDSIILRMEAWIRK